MKLYFPGSKIKKLPGKAVAHIYFTLHRLTDPPTH